ncbi:MAG: acyl carrier protein [Burkholderiaceae bacterium]
MNTYDELIELLSPEFHLDRNAIEPDKDLADYGMDSLTVVELMFVVEEHFGIDLPSDVTAFKTLSDLAAVIDRLRLAQAA